VDLADTFKVVRGLAGMIEAVGRDGRRPGGLLGPVR
jgi:hypothetical protein